ncbi:hypothetical protein QFC22_006377 [Naganishia vaughanmartiniae]|uniref:Uncharacterized protein n=1 Tax=Naganishia vaughanmartiniae TaxID=1424756 RepID=A0ACC2WKS7_9TREE|nr:hypothetical protein QFC22_006377 [Naganishia vaughanmartiniae]
MDFPAPPLATHARTSTADIRITSSPTTTNNSDASQPISPTSDDRIPTRTRTSARADSDVSTRRGEGVKEIGGASGRSTPSHVAGGRNHSPHPPSSTTDPRYRRFSQQIEKALATFTEVSEWADFSAFLSRLHKALQTPPASTSSGAPPVFTDIPHKLIIAKRLAQGLNPALPNGVHSRSLDVYRLILLSIGPAGLTRDLQIWSSGLLPFFQYASTAVRPAVLEIYETFYLPLGPALRPVSKALALALLPGIEEETGDFYDRCFRLLDCVSEAVGPAFLVQCLLLALLTNPGSRVSAMGYLNKRLAPALAAAVGQGVSSSSSEVPRSAFTDLIGPDSGLMVRGLSAALRDSNVLVLRAVLDFLNTAVPVTALIQPSSIASEDDTLMLVSAACSIVLRKDLSLSRRLYTWFLGSGEEDGPKQSERFRRDGMGLVIESLKRDIAASHMSEMDAEGERDPETDPWQAYKVFVALLDKWEIGYPLSEGFAYFALDSLRLQRGGDAESMRISSQAIYNAVEPVLGAMDESYQDSERLFENPEIEVIVHVIEMLIQNLSTEVEDVPRPTSDSTEDSLVRLTSLARNYYGSEANFKPPNESTVPVPEVAIFLFQGLTAATSLVTMKRTLPHLQVLRLLQALIMKLNGMEVRLQIPWARSDFLQWMSEMLKTDEQDTLAQITDIATELQSYLGLEPSLDLAQTGVPKSIQATAFRLLQGTRTSQHPQLVSLILRMHTEVNPGLIENVIMECFSNQNTCMRSCVYAFSALWDASLESRHLPLDRPMFFLLDNIESPKPEVQRSVQAWLKQEPQGFIKMIDRILCSMLSQSPPVDPGTVHCAGRDCEYLLFQRPADIRILTYHVSKLHEVIRIGGRPLRLVMEERVVEEPTLSAYSKTIAMPQPCHYSHFVLETLVRFLFSRASFDQTPHNDLHFYIRVTQLVRFLCATEWHFTPEILSTLKHDIINRLSFAVALHEIDLQVELLKLLQRLTLRSQIPDDNSRKSISKGTPEHNAHNDAEQQNCALLLQVVHGGITDEHNAGILDAWLDFTLVLGNSLPSSVRPLLFPLIDVISHEILQLAADIFQPSRIPQTNATSEDNLILLLRTVNSLVHYTLGDGFKAGQSNPNKTPVIPNESIGLLGYVFSSTTTTESEITTIENGLPKTAGLESMRSVIALLMDVYVRSGESLEKRIEAETQAAMRNFYRLHPEEFVESVVDIAIGEKPFKDAATIVDDVAESAYRVVDLITSVLSKRLAVGEEQRKRNLHLTTDSKMLVFLRGYISRLEAPIAVQTGSFCLGLAKTLMQSSNVGQKRRLTAGVFQILNVVLVKVASTSALTDRRYRKDVQDTFMKMLDTTAASVSETTTALNQVESSQKDVRNRAIETRQFMADVTVPSLRNILIEEDRVLQAAAIIVNTFVLPTLRARSRSDLTTERQTLEILLGLSRITYTLKLWKAVVLDIFNDPEFFNMKPELRPMWRLVIASLMDQDRERFPELLVRIGAPLSGNFFTNKEQEAANKATNIRRLSLLLFAAETNHYLIQLPHIQERLVEILRAPSAYPAITAEIYLCLRIMLCRFSSQQLTNFWPMILSELIKIFESAMADLPKDGSDQLIIVLAACKFLDLLIALQLEDFQIGKRRPVLASLNSKIQSIRTLEPFFLRASTLAYEGIYQAVAVDWEYIEQALDDEIFRVA